MSKPPSRKANEGPARSSGSILKRYLKPLLEKRDDLVLVGRLLLIRPVRHLIRGPISSPAENNHFQIWVMWNPLYAPAGERFGESMISQPRVGAAFPSRFSIDMLTRKDVFAKLGRITTLTDFAEVSSYLDPR